MSEHDRAVAWGEELQRIHRRLRDALALTRNAIDDAETGAGTTADPNADAARDLLLYCRGFCQALSGHHRGEDAVLFPELLADHPALAPVITQLSTDHSMIEYLLNGLAAAIETGAPAAEQLRHLDGIEAVMETHFRYEEKMLVGLLNASELAGTKHGYLGPLAE
ncbi:hemerythrin domain-containing protein [Microlunatus parietis]|uniref:Hemerythrin-like domain-containing protein n=1 Tax=Microlunatus parietis TaxID=682979 RepID=A0A7Y9I6W7_9ACTN|nr:hemerythrin domain-containing protein [Microlunatus parietis]NYE70879.1 hemerythrin-like domain-containing protein [Microlunatus parietis]